jgi:hypothetical protein
MTMTRLAALLDQLAATLRARIDRLRARPDHGGHAVEYAIGIGGSAFVILSVIAALKTGLAAIIANWVFK